MTAELLTTVVSECDPFPARKTKRGACKYPFGDLDRPGMGLDVHNRSLSSVRQAMKRWLEENAGVELSVRQYSEKVVRVRRDK